MLSTFIFFLSQYVNELLSFNRLLFNRVRFNKSTAKLLIRGE
jgi:hypothetical protein